MQPKGFYNHFKLAQYNGEKEATVINGKLVSSFEIFSDVYDFNAGKPKQEDEILSDELMNELF